MGKKYNVKDLLIIIFMDFYNFVHCSKQRVVLGTLCENFLVNVNRSIENGCHIFCLAMKFALLMTECWSFDLCVTMSCQMVT